MTPEEKRGAILAAIPANERIHRHDLEQILADSGAADAATEIVPMLREGILEGQDLFDDEGRHIGALIWRPD